MPEHMPPAPLSNCPPSSSNPEFLIIGLFALRLAKRLVEQLEFYVGRDDDIRWLVDFLAPYHASHALAKISGSRKTEYMVTYPRIVSRMKRQPRYPIHFMQMNPAQFLQRGQRNLDHAQHERCDMTDAERLDFINFCDAAGEWGSIVPMPNHEAGRMIALAELRQIADLDHVQPQRDRVQLQYVDRQLRRME